MDDDVVQELETHYLAEKVLDKKLLEHLELLAKKLNILILDSLNDIDFPKNILNALSYQKLKKLQAIPIEEAEEKITIAVAHPLNLDAEEYFRILFDKPVHSVFCEKEKILKAIDKCYHQEEGATKKLLEDLTENTMREDLNLRVEENDILDDRSKTPVVRLINFIFQEAISLGASDIHFEPIEDQLRIRYRIDGVLQSRHFPPKEYTMTILTRIKVLAEMDIAERRLPQDGRIKLKLGGKDFDLRVSTVPSASGERIVLRILDSAQVIIGLDNIGMDVCMLKTYKKLIYKPEGILLVTGPTGSGKTTTLYSSLFELNKEDVNIMTIEDPIEYKMHGIAQMAVKPKISLTFSKGLKHILRQDPDIIMLGEIRDLETAEIAIQASLTGHLVLSTLHTNDAPSAITRLVDMGIEPYLLSSSLVGVLAQRLVRKICPFCKGIKLEVECSKCFGTGYKGRQGIYELMEVNLNLKRAITQSQDSSYLKSIAVEEGMTTLVEHGKSLAKSGATTMQEVLRVTHEH